MDTSIIDSRFVIGTIAGIFSISILAQGEERYQIPLRKGVFTPDPNAPIQLSSEITSHVIIQFNELPTIEDREKLTKSGIRLISPTSGGFAWFAAISPAQEMIETLSGESAGSANGNDVVLLSGEDSVATQIETTVQRLSSSNDDFASIRAVATLPPIYKMSENCEKGSFGNWAPNANQSVEVELEVTIWDDVPLEKASEQLVTAGFELNDNQFRSAENILLVKNGTSEICNRLAALDFVAWVAQVPPPKTNQNDGALENIEVDKLTVSRPTLLGSNVILGIWDGGLVETNHPDFNTRLKIGDSSTDINSHATHVAGTMAGSGDNSASLGGGVKQWRGVAPAATIVTYKWDELSKDLKDAILTKKIQLSQNSWGYAVDEWRGNCDYYGDYTSVAKMYDEIVTGFHSSKIPVVFAAGNERNDADCRMNASSPFENYETILVPATAKNVISVGAINSDDSTMTAFSSWGPVDDGRLKPDIVAPGCERNGEGVVKSTIPGSKYGGKCGTSMAAPVVSGVVALILQNSAESLAIEIVPSTIKAALINTAFDLGRPGPDFEFGYGKVNAVEAVSVFDNKNNFLQQSVENGKFSEYEFVVSSSTENIKLTLAWDDVPASVNTSKALVNNLDLEVVDPMGNVYQPYILNPNKKRENAKNGTDELNVVEQVFIENPASGKWIVKISGTYVALGPQAYSLVSSVPIYD